MGEVINLRLARKHRERQAREEKAQENRAAFGRAKNERDLTGARAKLESDRLDAHKRESGSDVPPSDGAA